MKISLKNLWNIRTKSLTFLSLCFFSVLGQSEKISKKIDSLNMILEIEERDQNKAQVYLKLSEEYLRNKPALGEKTALKSLALFRAVNDSLGVVKALTKIANNQMYLARFEEASENIEEALKLTSDNEHLKKLEAEVLNIYAGIYFFQGQIDQALEILIKARKAYNYNSDTISVIMINRNLARIYEQKGDFKSAAQAQILGVKLAEEFSDTRIRDEAKLFLSIFYREAGDLESALTQLELFYEIALEKNFAEEMKSFALVETAKCHELLGSFSKAASYYKRALDLIETLESNLLTAEHLSDLSLALVKSEQIEEAEPYIRRAIELGKSNGFPKVLCKSYYAKALLNYKRENYSQARKSCFEGLNILPQSENQLISRDLYGLMSTLYLQEKDFEQAIIYKNLETTLKDSIQNETNARLISKLQVLYETDKKEQQIELLSQQNQIANLEIEQRKTFMFVSSLGLILAVISIALLFLLNRNSKKNNRLLVQKNEEIEKQNEKIVKQNNSINEALIEKSLLLKEMHHRTKNNLGTVESLLRLTAKDQENNNEEAKLILNESRNRVKAMALIHDHLAINNSDAIRLNPYLNDLITFMKSTLASKNIAVSMNVTPNIQLSADETVPLVLIINELILNSYKYAFSEVNSGNIEIHIRNLKSKEIQLTYRDNGPGIQKEAGERTGIFLINGLAKQMNGKPVFSSDMGFRFDLVFKTRKILEQA